MNRIATITLAALGLSDRVGMFVSQPPSPKPRTAPKPAQPAPLQQGSAPLDLSQLMGCCHRLQEELEISADSHPPLKARIDRLLIDLAITRSEIAALQAAEDESSEDPPPSH